MGNSEVGHLNLGAGRVVYQDLTRISKGIRDGTFFQNEVILSAIRHALSSNGTLHLMGLLSDGGVHSHNTHLYALLELAKKEGLSRVAIHAFLDGRDVPPTSAAKYVADLQSKIVEIGVGCIATITGRYFAMDRDNRWERTQKAYNALVSGIGRSVDNPVKALQDLYDEGINDEFVEPMIVAACQRSLESLGGSPTITGRDSVFFFNFRPDRSRQLSRALVFADFDGFNRGESPPLPYFATLTEYDSTIPVYGVAYRTQDPDNVLSEVLSGHGLSHLHLAETEKYAHVTYFFNGGIEDPFPGEERVLVPSPKVSTYDLQPEMSAHEVCRNAVDSVTHKKHDFIIMNFANPDMVGHTGDVPAAIKAIETIDGCLGDITRALVAVGGEAIILSDHGNAERMVDEHTGKPLTAHTPNPVPIIYLTERNKEVTLRDRGTLADIAPTILKAMDIPQPPEMTGVPVF